MSLLMIAAAFLGGTDSAPADVAPKAEKPKLVCKAVKVTGSRLGRRQICMTKDQWAQESDEISRSVQGGLGKSNKIPGN